MSSYGEAPGQTSCVYCPRAMVGRVIGRQGETIKALQAYTGASIQIDQSREPSAVTISGEASAVVLAQAMIQDIVNGTFKGFAMLRQMVHASLPMEGGLQAAPLPVYIEGYGFVPPTQAQEARIFDGQDVGLTRTDVLPQFYPLEQMSESSMAGFGAVNSPTGGNAFPIPMPRTPEAYPYQRTNPSGLESTPEGTQYNQLQGSPDINDMLSNLRFAVPSTIQQGGGGSGSGRLPEPKTPGTDFWVAQQPQRQYSGSFSGAPYSGFTTGATGDLSSGGSSSSGAITGLRHSSLHGRSAGQPIPSSSAMLAAMQSKCDTSDTFPQRWSYPGTSVLSGGAAMSSLKIGRISADNVLSSAIPGSAMNDKSGGTPHISSFKSDSQDVGHIGTPPRGAHFPSAAAFRSSTGGGPFLDTSPAEGLTCGDVAIAHSPHKMGFTSGEFTKAFSMPSSTQLPSPLVSPKVARQILPNTAAAGNQPEASDASWMQLTDPEGRRFWHNCSTGRSQWASPESSQA